MVIEDHAGEFLDRVRFARKLAGQFEGGATRGGNRHAVEAHVHAVHFRCHGLRQIEILEGGVVGRGNHFVIAHCFVPFLSGFSYAHIHCV